VKDSTKKPCVCGKVHEDGFDDALAQAIIEEGRRLASLVKSMTSALGDKELPVDSVRAVMVADLFATAAKAVENERGQRVAMAWVQTAFTLVGQNCEAFGMKGYEFGSTIIEREVPHGKA
jgi:hypothetical protein